MTFVFVRRVRSACTKKATERERDAGELVSDASEGLVMPVRSQDTSPPEDFQRFNLSVLRVRKLGKGSPSGGLQGFACPT